MNVVFVCHTNFRLNSGIQMFHLANALSEKGCAVVCVVPDGKETVSDCGAPRFTAIDAGEAEGLTFPDDGPPTLIHAWTPREHVRKIVESLATRHACPIVVHLEDNEEVVAAAGIGLTVDEVKELHPVDLERRLPSYVSHPHRSIEFLKRSNGVTMLVDRLREFAPPGVPTRVFSPSCDPTLFHPMTPDEHLRDHLGIAPEDIVLCYNGNVHQANVQEVRSLYLSVLFLNRMGRRARLVRLGSGIDCMSNVTSELLPYVIELGVKPNREIPKYLALATALVQPGAPGVFNDFRFPSKIPEFLAMGKPVILPRCNIGLELTNGENCLLLEAGHAGEIVDRVMAVYLDRTLASRLSAGARRFFEVHLSWDRAADLVLGFYEMLLTGHRTRKVSAGRSG